MSSKPSLSILFPLNRTLDQLAPAISDVVAKEGEIAAHNNSQKLSGGVKLCKDALVCSVFNRTDS